MILEVLFGLVVVLVMAFVAVKLWDDFKMKKLRRGYNENEDKGRRVEDFYSGSNRGKANIGEPILQDDVEYAKQAILSGREVGTDNSDKPTDSELNLNHRY